MTLTSMNTLPKTISLGIFILTCSDNIGDYSKLFNSLLVTKNEKRKKYDTLKANYNQMLYQKVDVWTEAILLEML